MQLKKFLVVALMSVVFSTVTAQKYTSKSDVEVKTTWNDATFSSKKTIGQNIEGLSSFSILNTILKNASITKLLASEEMVTVFIPTDQAFEALSKRDRKDLLDNNKRITKLIQFLAVPGRLDYNSITTSIEKNNGSAYFTTLAGERLGATMKDGSVVLTDSKGHVATLTASDFYHKNGFFHMVDGLIFPVQAE